MLVPAWDVEIKEELVATWVADELVSAVVTSDVVKVFVDDSKFVFVVVVAVVVAAVFVVAAIVESVNVVLSTVDVSVELQSEMTFDR